MEKNTVVYDIRNNSILRLINDSEIDFSKFKDHEDCCHIEMFDKNIVLEFQKQFN